MADCPRCVQNFVEANKWRERAFADEARVSELEAELAETRELLRQARDVCLSATVEEGISAARKEYRIELFGKIDAALKRKEADHD